MKDDILKKRRQYNVLADEISKMGSLEEFAKKHGKIENSSSLDELLGHLELERYNIPDGSKNAADELLKAKHPELYETMPALITRGDVSSQIKALKRMNPNLSFTEKEARAILGQSGGLKMGEDITPMYLYVNPNQNVLSAGGTMSHEGAHAMDSLAIPQIDTKEVNNAKKTLMASTKGHHLVSGDNYEMQRIFDLTHNDPIKVESLPPEVKTKWGKGIGNLNPTKMKIRGGLPAAAGLLAAAYTGDSYAADPSGSDVAGASPDSIEYALENRLPVKSNVPLEKEYKERLSGPVLAKKLESGEKMTLEEKEAIKKRNFDVFNN